MDELPNEQKGWLEAAQNGDLMAAFNIGKYYQDAKKFEDAKKWLHKVAVQGHLGGLFKYGELLISMDMKDDAKNWLKIQYK